MKKVWKGVFEVWDLTQNIVWDSGKRKFIDRKRDFTSNQEVGYFAPKRCTGCSTGKENSIQEYREAEVKNMGLSGKKEWECRIRIPHSRLCINMRWSFIKLFQDMYKEQSGGETGALKDCLKETFPSLRVAAPSPWQSKNGEREGAVTRRLY